MARISAVLSARLYKLTSSTRPGKVHGPNPYPANFSGLHWTRELELVAFRRPLVPRQRASSVKTPSKAAEKAGCRRSLNFGRHNFILDYRAPFHDEQDTLHAGNICERIAFDGDDVGKFAGFEHADGVR